MQRARAQRRLLSEHWLPAAVAHLHHEPRLGQLGEAKHHPFNPAHFSVFFSNKNIMGVKSRSGMRVKMGGRKKRKNSASAQYKFIVRTIFIIITL